MNLGIERNKFPVEIVELRPGDRLSRGDYDIVVFETEHRAGHRRVRARRARAAGAVQSRAGARAGDSGRAALGTAAQGRGRSRSRTGGRWDRRIWWVGRGPGGPWSTPATLVPRFSVMEAARGADLLVHEATFGGDEAERAKETGHSTAAEAAPRGGGRRRPAARAHHISPRYSRDAPELLAEAQAVFPETIIARDGLTVDVPFVDCISGHSPRRLPKARRHREEHVLCPSCLRVTATGVAHEKRPTRYELFLLTSLVVLLVWSRIGAYDPHTWLLEVFPILIGVPVLIILYPGLRLTPLVYTLIWIHAGILMLGGHYTYARVPLGFWMEGWFGFHRNNYDRIGHLAQGFIPAMVAREIFIRRSPFGRTRWLPFMTVCFCLAFSAFYELIEFWTALAEGRGATTSRHPGRSWDTQWDMMMALIGSILALVLLSRWHDRQLAEG